MKTQTQTQTALRLLLAWHRRPWGAEDGPEIDAIVTQCEKALASDDETISALGNLVAMVDFLGVASPPELESKIKRTMDAARTAIANARVTP